MALERRWIARCDTAGCDTVLVCPSPDPDPDDKWSAGISASDAGWDARPCRRDTYCPTHSQIEEDDT